MKNKLNLIELLIMCQGHDAKARRRLLMRFGLGHLSKLFNECFDKEGRLVDTMTGGTNCIRANFTVPSDLCLDICGDCAKKLGAEAVDGVVTAHRGVCPYCSEVKILNGLNDYIWPGEKRTSLSWD